MFLTSSLICILTLYLKRTVVSTCVCIIWTFIVFCQLFSQSSGVWLLCATPAPAWNCQACQIQCLILHLLPGIIELWTCLYAAHGVPWRRHLYLMRAESEVDRPGLFSVRGGLKCMGQMIPHTFKRTFQPRDQVICI